MAAILQTTFWTAVCSMKKVDFFYQNFTDKCSLGSNWQYDCIVSDNGLAANRWQAIIWNSDDRIHWRIYASLCLSELTRRALDKMATILHTFSCAWCYFLESIFLCMLIQIALMFVLGGPIDKSSLVQVMAWHLFSAKPLSGPMMTQFINCKWHH